MVNQYNSRFELENEKCDNEGQIRGRGVFVKEYLQLLVLND